MFLRDIIWRIESKIPAYLYSYINTILEVGSPREHQSTSMVQFALIADEVLKESANLKNLLLQLNVSCQI